MLSSSAKDQLLWLNYSPLLLDEIQVEVQASRNSMLRHFRRQIEEFLHEILPESIKVSCISKRMCFDQFLGVKVENNARCKCFMSFLRRIPPFSG